LGQNLKKNGSRDPDHTIQTLALDIFYLHTKFGDSRFIRSGDMIVGVKSENGSCDLNHARFWGGLLAIS